MAVPENLHRMCSGVGKTLHVLWVKKRRPVCLLLFQFVRTSEVYVWFVCRVAASYLSTVISERLCLITCSNRIFVCVLIKRERGNNYMRLSGQSLNYLKETKEILLKAFKSNEFRVFFFIWKFVCFCVCMKILKISWILVGYCELNSEKFFSLRIHKIHSNWIWIKKEKEEKLLNSKVQSNDFSGK